ncbi:MAG TPA: alpha/beta hydrolase-fold protein [Vicinamibacterales bacterium]|nr:alpha/beta hydrolase-fold protein [Vicinamibacterales bacterium]
MHREHHRWYSDRLGRDMGVVVHGHWGAPMILFPTSGGDEWEYEQQSMIGALAEFIEAGRLKTFSVNVNHGDSFANHRAHPLHRSWMQRQYDAYVRYEAVPFVRSHCRSDDIGISTMGASLGGYHAANTLFKYPDVVKRCFALSAVYDMKRFMDGAYDDNFYFNNPVDYMANAADPWQLGHLASCDIHLVTGSGPWEKSDEAYRMSHILSSRGIRHHLDDWGPLGGHDWPYWKHQMQEYLRDG